MEDLFHQPPPPKVQQPCHECAMRSARAIWHGYDFACIECCARLVRSAYPSKPQASAMLACIARYPEAPKRADVLERVGELAAHNNVPP